MTVNELIKELEEIVNEEPERGELEVGAYSPMTSDYTGIESVDNTIMDRVDLNLDDYEY